MTTDLWSGVAILGSRSAYYLANLLFILLLSGNVTANPYGLEKIQFEMVADWEQIHLTADEFNAIIGVLLEQPEITSLIRLKADKRTGLYRPVTVTPDALYIHCRNKGSSGPKYVGKGAESHLYYCLKIRDGQIMLMVDKVYQPKDPPVVGRVMRDEERVRALACPQIRGPAELIYEYGNGKVCQILARLDKTVNDWMRTDHPSLKELLWVWHDLAIGLAHIHRQGYAHGDINKANMMVRKDRDRVRGVWIDLTCEGHFADGKGRGHHRNDICRLRTNLHRALKPRLPIHIRFPNLQTAQEIADFLQTCIDSLCP